MKLYGVVLEVKPANSRIVWKIKTPMADGKLYRCICGQGTLRPRAKARCKACKAQVLRLVCRDNNFNFPAF